MVKAIRINHTDNVAVAVQPLPKGSQVTVDGMTVNVADDIPAGHKIAITDMDAGTDVIKYGFPIGHVTSFVAAGHLVNENNLKTNLKGKLEYSYNPVQPVMRKPVEPVTFKGYMRRDGQVGIRNEIWIIPTVGCVNGIAMRLAERLREETGSGDIFAFTHNYGCSQLGTDHENTRHILADMIHHPNAGAVLVVGLGCENNQPDRLEELCGDYDRERVKFVVTQQIKGDEVEYCMPILRRLYGLTLTDRRTDCSFSELRIGLKCGSSDGFSGITANPLLGGLSDMVIDLGGTAVMTEVPEMFGAETILMDRCRDHETFLKTVCLINDFKEYYISHGEPVGENPSPGNKAGGISTLEEKSLGCTQKGGTSQVTDVLGYGDRLKEKGLNLLSAPGNDLVSSTALAAAGCQLVLFTTGHGTPFGTFVPTAKISTNTGLFEEKPHWIDFNAGSLLQDVSYDSLLTALFNFLKEVAEGRTVKNEVNGYREIAIFKNGVTL